jgi:hypothetical protein
MNHCIQLGWSILQSNGRARAQTCPLYRIKLPGFGLVRHNVESLPVVEFFVAREDQVYGAGVWRLDETKFSKSYAAPCFLLRFSACVKRDIQRPARVGTTCTSDEFFSRVFRAA